MLQEHNEIMNRMKRETPMKIIAPSGPGWTTETPMMIIAHSSPGWKTETSMKIIATSSLEWTIDTLITNTDNAVEI